MTMTTQRSFCRVTVRDATLTSCPSLCALIFVRGQRMRVIDQHRHRRHHHDVTLSCGSSTLMRIAAIRHRRHRRTSLPSSITSNPPRSIESRHFDAHRPSTSYSSISPSNAASPCHQSTHDSSRNFAEFDAPHHAEYDATPADVNRTTHRRVEQRIATMIQNRQHSIQQRPLPSIFFARP